MDRKESAEQAALMEWCAWNSGKYPELRLLFHIPNGGSRNKAEAAHLKRQGVKAGAPDLMLPVARGGFHGLFIEMKAAKGRLSPFQAEWIAALRGEGYRAAVCYGFGEARDTLVRYLEEEME